MGSGLGRTFPFNSMSLNLFCLLNIFGVEFNSKTFWSTYYGQGTMLGTEDEKKKVFQPALSMPPDTIARPV